MGKNKLSLSLRGIPLPSAIKSQNLKTTLPKSLLNEFLGYSCRFSIKQKNVFTTWQLFNIKGS